MAMAHHAVWLCIPQHLAIWGLDDIKKGMLLQLFGGTGKRFKGGGAPRCRGEINILLCGDPGTTASDRAPICSFLLLLLFVLPQQEVLSLN